MQHHLVYGRLRHVGLNLCGRFWCEIMCKRIVLPHSSYVWNTAYEAPFGNFDVAFKWLQERTQSVCGSLNHWHQVPGMKVDFCSKVVQLEWPVHL